MKHIFLLLVFVSVNLITAPLVTEDLGSIEKKKSNDPGRKDSVVDYTKLNNNAPIVAPVENKKNKLVPEANLSVEVPNKKENEFFRALGNITIRATREYVYIRAGKSAVIMNNEGKIVIESDKDLTLTANKSLILKAKEDIFIQPGGKLHTPINTPASENRTPSSTNNEVISDTTEVKEISGSESTEINLDTQ